ncbi:hypothetical protein [Spirulina subsalsa]|uniref:hypothetical protein n=1 Tax=Spirulina subsalsa TaxID=54311 RepID=UPI0002D75B77|nr:hypothetical protein [Spirulina subsalsa]
MFENAATDIPASSSKLTAPPWLRFLWRPMLLISLGLHGGILFLPLQEDSPQTEAKINDEDLIKITQLPSRGVDVPPIPEPETPSLPDLAPTPQPEPSPSLPSWTPPPLNLPSPRFEIPPFPQPTPTPRPSPTPQVTPSPRPSPTPQVTPSPFSSPLGGRQGENRNNPQGLDTRDPFADFPNYCDSFTCQRGALNLLSAEFEQGAFHTSDSLENVANWYQKNITKAGFNEPQKMPQSSGMVEIYQVSKGNSQPRFLHLLKVQDKTVILLLSQPIAETELARLRNLENLSPEESEFEQIFLALQQELGLENFQESDLVDPSLGSGQTLRGRLPGSSGLSQEAFEQRVIARLKARNFVEKEVSNDFKQDGVYYLEKGNSVWQVVFTPVRVGNETRVGVMSSNVSLFFGN